MSNKIKGDLFIGRNLIVDKDITFSKFTTNGFLKTSNEDGTVIVDEGPSGDSKTWISLVSEWTEEPVNEEYSGTDGEVLKYTYGLTNYYRFIPNPYNSNNDGFYENYTNPTLSDLIITRGKIW
jgi:hypothetical protein